MTNSQKTACLLKDTWPPKTIISMGKTQLQEDIRISLHLVAVILAVLGALGYLVAMYWWSRTAYDLYQMESRNQGPDWWELRHAIAAPLLFGTFLAAILMRRRTKVFRAFLAAACVTMVCWSLYDCYHRHYQIGSRSLEYGWGNYHVLGKGAQHFYFNWPWLTGLEPWLPSKR